MPPHRPCAMLRHPTRITTYASFVCSAAWEASLPGGRACAPAAGAGSSYVGGCRVGRPGNCWREQPGIPWRAACGRGRRAACPQIQVGQNSGISWLLRFLLAVSWTEHLSMSAVGQANSSAFSTRPFLAPLCMLCNPSAGGSLLWRRRRWRRACAGWWLDFEWIAWGPSGSWPRFPPAPLTLQQLCISGSQRASEYPERLKFRSGTLLGDAPLQRKPIHSSDLFNAPQIRPVQCPPAAGCLRGAAGAPLHPHGSLAYWQPGARGADREVPWPFATGTAAQGHLHRPLRCRPGTP